MNVWTNGWLLTLRLAIAMLALIITVSTGADGLTDADLASVLQLESERIETIRRISAPTIAVFGPKGGGGGSGVIISPDGYALTNFHVTKPCGDHMRVGMNDGKMVDAVIVGLDPTGDVALIKLLGRDDFPVADLGDSDELRAGESCYVVGNPFLLATDFRPTVTFGIISGVHRYQYPSGSLLEYADCIQTDASINPGNSGGPLFNSRGQLVGINGRCSFEKRGRVNVGVGYAISINQIRKFLGYLKSGRIVDHATAGFNVSTDEDGRTLVTEILESSDAWRRGLRFNDEIVSFGGRPIRSANEFKNILGTFPRGWRVPLSYRQDGERKDVLVRLAGVHSRGALVALVQDGPNAMPGEEPDGKEQDDKIPKDPKEKKRPRLLPRLKRKSDPKMPAAVVEKIEKRRGYSNYYFNRQNLLRVWAAFEMTSRFPRSTGEWVIQGELGDENGGTFEVILRQDEAFMDLPSGQFRIGLDRNLDGELSPPQSGGMLLAIAMWQRLLVLGPEKFGEVHYLGSVPSATAFGEWDSSKVHEVLVATHDAVECHFYFDTDSGRMDRMELFPTTGVDPCELIFAPVKEIGGQRLPASIGVRFGDFEVANLKIKTVTVDAGGQEL